MNDAVSNELRAPFPYFGGKSRAASVVWRALGDPPNYVEPFSGSAAMLLARPGLPRGTETINDADGFVSNFWRAVAADAGAVAAHADWPINETDLIARHSWLVRNRADLTERLEGDPDYYDARIAGWWCWGASSWIGDGWCSGGGRWVHDGERLVDRRLLGDAGCGVSRRLPHMSRGGMGVHRKPPNISGGKGVHRRLQKEALLGWFNSLMERMRKVRVSAGDWQRVLTPCVTVGYGLTGVFLDPPYTTADMDYAVGGVGGKLAGEVREWCAEHGADSRFRIVLCGHAGEHDALLDLGWDTRVWISAGGYSRTPEARARAASETVWCSPHCVRADALRQQELF